MRNLFLQNGATYAFGTLLSVLVYPYMKEALFYRGDWTVANWYATGILFLLLAVISCLCNGYIYRIEPKEILVQAKVWEKDGR